MDVGNGKFEFRDPGQVFLMGFMDCMFMGASLTSLTVGDAVSFYKQYQIYFPKFNLTTNFLDSIRENKIAVTRVIDVPAIYIITVLNIPGVQ